MVLTIEEVVARAVKSGTWKAGDSIDLGVVDTRVQVIRSRVE